MCMLYDIPDIYFCWSSSSFFFFFYKSGRIKILQRWLHWWFFFFWLVQECQCCNFWHLNEDNIKFAIVDTLSQSSVYVHNKQVEMFQVEMFQVEMFCWNSVLQHACRQLFTCLDNDVNLHVMVSVAYCVQCLIVYISGSPIVYRSCSVPVSLCTSPIIISHSRELQTEKLRPSLLRTRADKCSFKAWSRAEYSCACFAHCQYFFIVLILTIQGIMLAFFRDI